MSAAEFHFILLKCWTGAVTVFRVGLPLLQRDRVLRQRRPPGGSRGVRGGDSIEAFFGMFLPAASASNVNK